jgi:hypothetical protein
MYGYKVSDNVCLSDGSYYLKNTCMSDLHFIAIKDHLGLPDGVQGLLGLAPTSNFTQILFAQGTIGHNILSFSFAEGDTYALFGAADDFSKVGDL